jgi:hypothetical protein
MMGPHNEGHKGPQGSSGMRKAFAEGHGPRHAAALAVVADMGEP